MTSLPRRAVSAAVLTALVPALVAPAASAAGESSTTAPRPEGIRRVTPLVQTPPVFDDEAGGDADADDPAIWVHPTDRSRSRVVATVKNAGLRVYDLKGRLVQSLPAPAAPGPKKAGHEPGRFNNVDIVRGMRLGGRTTDVAIASDRGRDQIRFYAIDARTGRLTDVTSRRAPFAFNRTQKQVDEQATIYGLDAFRSRGRTYVVGTRRHTSRIGLFEVVPARDGLTYRRVDTLDFPTSFRLPDGTAWTPCGDPGEGPQLEGVVVDERTRTLYAAQEDVGLYRVRMGAGRFAGRPVSIERTTTFGVPAHYDARAKECVAAKVDPGFGGRLVADVEGLTILATGRTTGRFVVSSQGDDTFYTYDRRTNRPLSHLQFVPGRDRAGRPIDGVQDSDGADVVATPLPGFPRGLLVVQDGDATPHVRDAAGKDRTGTNFKFVDAGVLLHR